MKNSELIQVVVEPQREALGNANTDPQFLKTAAALQPDPPPDSELATVPAGRRVSKAQLVNRLNFINFQDGTIQVHFAHRHYDRALVLPAVPLPCLGDALDCRWADTAEAEALKGPFTLTHILVPRGQRFIRVHPEVLELNATGVRLALPEHGQEISHRGIERHSGVGISVYVIQNSSLFPGSLVDFTATSFRLQLKAEPPQTFQWIDPELPVHVIFFAESQSFYSGECRIVRHTQGSDTRNYVLQPLSQRIQRFRKAEYRSQRQMLTPAPNMVFRHPLSRRRVELKVIDLSGSGFSVEEEEQAAVLLPGLILPEIELHFATGFRLSCSAQVVFRMPAGSRQNTPRVRCGLALIDVKAQDHVKLLAMLHQLKDQNSYICNDVDLEALWDFLFETGFIYPGKYTLIEKSKKAIKSTYENLYTRSPNIARHFVYQENGCLLGHMAMIRFWRRSWLIHHHAARKSALNRAGLVVLDQIGRFTYDSYRLPSMHLDYLVCYYRPQNKFPSRVFGGVARHIDNPKACSVDAFAFVNSAGSGDSEDLPEGWTLETAVAENFTDLEYFYKERSDGLMLAALDLEQESWRRDDLAEEYRRLGFRRERHCFALKFAGAIRALLVANVSDVGLNLSDLTNCINAVVLDPEGLTPATLQSALSQVLRITGQQDVPALIYPLSWAEDNQIPFQKAYNLWVLRIHGQSDAYFRYLNRLLRYV